MFPDTYKNISTKGGQINSKLPYKKIFNDIFIYLLYTLIFNGHNPLTQKHNENYMQKYSKILYTNKAKYNLLKFLVKYRNILELYSLH